MRGVFVAILMALVAVCAQSCASPYQQAGITGGYDEREISPNVWRIIYAGNGFTTYETVQAYWLYHAAEFTLGHGSDGFEIITNMQLTGLPANGRFVPAQYYLNHSDLKPSLVGDIRLLKKPLRAIPPRSFDAATVKTLLEPRIKNLCGTNICPHVHDYLFPPIQS